MAPTKTILTALTCLGFMNNKLHAQYHDLKLDIGGLFVSSYGIGYEYCLDDESGINFRVGYLSSNDLIRDIEEEFNSFTLTGEYRYYYNYNDGADDFFFGGYVKYRNLISEDYYIYRDPVNNSVLSTQDFVSNSLGLGAIVGSKWIAGKGFVVETYGGIGRYFIENAVEPEQPNSREELSDLIDVRIGVVLGWRIEKKQPPKFKRS